MANLSWTYDSAVAAVALVAAGEKAQAEQILDQLAALQRTDGSVDATKSAFVQGTADSLRPLDVQTLGLLFLQRNPAGKNPNPNLAKVRSYLNSYAVSSRTVLRSTDSVGYNNTYAAGGAFSGYRPYAAAGPDVLWAEGTAQVRYTLRALGESTIALNSAISAWDAITTASAKGPLGSDRTAADEINEYHVWPTASAASWTLLGGTSSLLAF